MIERLGTRMPSTSNALESLHGHLNGLTPRLNLFWGSLLRLGEAIVRKTASFRRCFVHNYRYECRRVAKRLSGIGSARMAREVAFFGASATQCLCGETVFAREMYRADLLCSHRLAAAGADRGAQPVPPEVYLSVGRRTWDTCVTALLFDERVPYRPRDLETEREIGRITRRIVREAHAGQRRGEIQRWVADNHRTSGEYALGETTAFWWLVEMGTEVFRGVG